MKKVLRIVAGVFFVLATLAYFPSVSSVLFLLAALAALPIPQIQEPLKKIIPQSAVRVILCLFLFAVGAVAAPQRETAERPSTDTTPDTAKVVETVEKTTETEGDTEPEEIKYKSGQYKVGTDIPAGAYCLWEDGFLPTFTISEDANGDEIIDWHTYSTNYIVEVRDGEYFKISAGYAVPYDGEKIAVLQDGYLCDGFYAVGVDIPAGEYKVVEEADAVLPSITTYSDLRGKIVDWITLDGDRYVELKEGQYVSVSDCKIYVGE